MSAVRHDWGWEGACRAAARGDGLVVVDVMRFSTATAVAVARGVLLRPCAEPLADPAARRWLSPLAYEGVEPGTQIVLWSPNGATCCTLAEQAARVWVGALVNAGAVAQGVSRWMATSGRAVTVLSAGERWAEPGRDGALRFAIEDYLGAGAILARLDPEQPRSPEAQVCEAAWKASASRVRELLLGSESGQELLAKGRLQEIELAARLDSLDSVPVVQDGWIRPYGQSSPAQTERLSSS
jgi:2-phosphosulfolactate phosphatase